MDLRRQIGSNNHIHRYFTTRARVMKTVMCNVGSKRMKRICILALALTTACGALAEPPTVAFYIIKTDAETLADVELDKAPFLTDADIVSYSSYDGTGYKCHHKAAIHAGGWNRREGLRGRCER